MLQSYASQNEVIVPVSMSPLQKEIYRSILSKLCPSDRTTLNHLKVTMLIC